MALNSLVVPANEASSVLVSTLRTSAIVPALSQVLDVSDGGLGNALWDIAGARPSLDLDFATTKSLVDRISGQSLITFGRAGGTATNVDATGTIVTAAANEPRFTHDPVTLRSLGLLEEEQRTNYIRNNTMVGAAAGTPGTLPTNYTTNGFNGLARQIVAVGVTAGVSYIDVRYSGTISTTFGNIFLDTATATPSANGVAWAESAWLQVVGGSLSGVANIALRLNQLDAAAVAIGFASEGTQSSAVSTTFQRITRSPTTNNASVAYVQPYIAIAFTNGAAIDITLRIGLPQLEQGAFATSVIPTTGTQATRNADVATITGAGFSSWYRQDEGTFYWSSAAGGSAGNAFEVSNGTANNRITGYNSSSTQPVLLIGSGGVNVFLNPGTIAANSRNAHAVAYKANNNAYSLNGGNPATDSTNLPPAGVSMLTIGANSFSSGYLNGTISRLTFFPQHLPTKLQAITA